MGGGVPRWSWSVRTRDSLQPDHLLAHAAALAGESAGAERPRQADLRRAVSASYYAVYHDVTLRAASQILGAEAGRRTQSPGLTAAVAHLVRWFTHAGVAQACRLAQELRVGRARDEWQAGKRSAWELLHAGHPDELPRHLVTLSVQVRELQGQRHDADYDHVTPVPREAALGAVRRARGMLDTLESHAADPPYRGFLVLVALCNKGLPPGV